MGAALIPFDEVLERLTRVFRNEGYEAASLARLSEATGLGKASLYHYFPGGKADMAAAVAERSNKIFGAKILLPLLGEGTPRIRIEGMLDNLDHYYSRGEDSCLLGMLAMGGNVTLFQKQVRAGIEGWILALAKVFREAGLTEDEAYERAEDAVLRIEGALLVARGFGDGGPFTRTLQRLREDLEKL